MTRIFMVKYDLTSDDPHDQRYQRSITNDENLGKSLFAYSGQFLAEEREKSRNIPNVSHTPQL